MTHKLNLDINLTLTESLDPVQKKLNPKAQAVITNLYQEFVGIKIGDGVGINALREKVLAQVQSNPLIPELQVIQTLFVAALNIKANDLNAAEENLKTIDSPQSSFISASIALEKLLKNPDDKNLRGQLSKYLSTAEATLHQKNYQIAPREKLLRNLANWLDWNRTPTSLAKNPWLLPIFLSVEKENSNLLGALKPTQKVLTETLGETKTFSELFKTPQIFDILQDLIKNQQINISDADYTTFFDNFSQALLNNTLPNGLESNKILSLLTAMDVNHTEFNYAKALFQLQPGKPNLEALNKLKQLADAKHAASTLFQSKITKKGNASIARGLEAIEDKKPLVMKKIEEFNQASKAKRNKIILIAILTLFSPILIPAALAALLLAALILFPFIPFIVKNPADKERRCPWLR